MPHDLPLACSLDAAQLSGRQEEMRAIGADALVGANRDGTRARLRFAPHADARARLDRIVEAESRCCPFLAMELGEDGGEVVLSVEAPEGAEAVLDGLVEAFAG